MTLSHTISAADDERAPAISVRNLTMGYGSRVLLQGAPDVQRGEILVIGGSGRKST
jgi:ABC-type transporter Mla maintaining outer membrane lipid asymmetry ATPase subunit MlaF